MKISLEDFATQYIIDEKGKKTGVIIDIEKFNALLEEIEDAILGLQAEKILREEGDEISHEEVKKHLLEKS